MYEFERFSALAQSRLIELFEQDCDCPEFLCAMKYSVLAGGKRLRPVLCLMGNALMGGDAQECLDLAVSVELIHTYSLIHDDLPCMDDDVLRRGKPTSHVVFGEAGAVLCGDALLNMAFELMITNAKKYPGNLLNHIFAMEIIATASGMKGMAGGQWRDIKNVSNTTLTEGDLTAIYACKTGALITAPLLAGLQLNSPTEGQIQALKTFGENIGLVFQITDDLLDVTGTQENMGKTLNKDEDQLKTTYVSLYGEAYCKEYAQRLTEEGIAALCIFDNAAPLMELARKMLNRVS